MFSFIFWLKLYNGLNVLCFFVIIIILWHKSVQRIVQLDCFKQIFYIFSLLLRQMLTTQIREG